MMTNDDDRLEDLKLEAGEEGDLWYKDAVIYELHVRAFFDSNDDGIGDFAGLTQKLDYLEDLGVTAIWLLPFYPSPFKDDGYDVSKHTAIHPAYGTLKDFKNLLRQATDRGIRIINELVINHTSDRHAWFQRAIASRPGSSARNFYVWSDNAEQYKEARVIFSDFESSNWAWDPVARAYYWHRFYSHQPDLNFDNPLVKKAVFRVLDFWLDMGVSGVRLDAVPYLYEREGTNCENLPETHAFLKEMRHHIDEKYSGRMLLAEANQWLEDAVAYFGAGDECHMAYNFPLMPRMFMSIRMEDRFPIIDILGNTPLIPDSCQWALFLRNHDELTLEMVTDEERDYMYRMYAFDAQARINLGIRRRLAPLLSNDRKKIELMNGLLFSLPGTPIIYYGDEIGMGDNFYLGDRNGVRTPMQWSADRNAGFSGTNPQRLYLPVNIDPEYHYEAVNVQAQQNNSDSLLWWMKRLIAQRRRFKAFSRGSLKFLYPDNRKILAFTRSFEGETMLVVANLSRSVQHTGLDLAGFEDKIPVEVFGQTEFPPVKDERYFITLGPYGFYWFFLESAGKAPEISQRSEEPVLPQIAIRHDLTEAYERAKVRNLEQALFGYLRNKRWFAGRMRYTRTLKLVDYIPLPYNLSAANITLVRVEYTEGEAENYLLPLVALYGDEAGAARTGYPDSIIANISGSGGEPAGVIAEGLIDENFRAALLKYMNRRRQIKGKKGEIVTSNIRRVFYPEYKTMSAETSRVLPEEQTNTSIVYDENFKLKMFRRQEEGESPELEMGRFLTGRNYQGSPMLAGAIEYRLEKQVPPVTLATLHQFVVNEGDGWAYTRDALGRYFDRVLAKPDISPPQAEYRSFVDISAEPVPEVMCNVLEEFMYSAQLLGKRSAEMHIMLSSDKTNPDFKPEAFSLAYQRSLAHRIRGLSSLVIRYLEDNIDSLPTEEQKYARRVVELAHIVPGYFKDITRKKLTGFRIRCHGDFHLGQVLYSGKDFLFIDFEGEPARSLGERRVKRSSLRDIAGMIRSFQYASFSALSERAAMRAMDVPVLEEWAWAWYVWVSAVYLKSYLDNLADSQILPRSRQERKALLDLYLMDKAMYEINYELSHRPTWIGLPIRGLLQLLEERSEEQTGQNTTTQKL